VEKSVEKKEKWQELCAQAALEQNPERLLVLARQISRLLDEKEERLTEKTTRQ
jgi:hypothetical protein